MRLGRLGAGAALSIVLLAAAIDSQAAVDDYLGRPVAAVRLVIEGRETIDPALMQVVEIEAGRPLAMSDVRESVAHLFSLGRFEAISVDAAAAGAGVTITFELSPGHPVTRIEFEGEFSVPGLSRRDLRRMITDRFGASPPVGRAADAQALIADVLRQRGYFHASVTPRADIAHDPDRATLVFEIDPGTRTTIASASVVGDAAEPPNEILSTLRLTTGAPYEPDVVGTRIDRYIEGQRRHGYYEAKVTRRVQLVDEDRHANVVVTVNMGPRVRVTFSGDPLPEDRREELVPVEREGSVDEDLLEDSSNRIQDFLREQGYRDALAAHTREQTPTELLVNFSVKRGPLFRVVHVEISGNDAVPLQEFEARLRLHDGMPFSDARLDADLGVIEDAYRRRGFNSVAVVSTLEPERRGDAEVLLVVLLTVREGPRTLVGSVTFSGNRSIPEAALRQAVGVAPGVPFVQGQLLIDRDALQIAYENEGYRNVAVTPVPRFSDDRVRVDVTFTIEEGPRVIVDHLLIVGNVRTKTETIERQLRVKAGDPLGREAIDESQRRLLALGLFRRASINEVRHGDEARRDVVVTVEEAPATTLGYGGGVEGRLRVIRTTEGGIAVERFEIAPRAFVDIGRRNLFGTNRSANLFTSVTVHPTNTTPVGPIPQTNYNLTEYRIVGTFRAPRILDRGADARVNGTIEQQIRSSFNFRRRSASAELGRRVTRNLSLSGAYQIQRTEVFDENVSPADQQLIDRVFTQVRVSSFSVSAIRDSRDDLLDPSRGEYFSASSEIAGRAIGSEVGFIRSLFTAQMFRIVPHSNRIVFAGNARLGLAAGFPRDVVDPVTGQPVVGPDGVPLVLKDLPQSERFYAGGDTTQRGFALDTLGVRHTPPHPDDTLDPNGFPLGGNALTILNAELRVPVKGGLTTVAFVDTGNVFKRPTVIDFTEFRTALGTGVRYKSPIGPIRFDVGFKVNRQPTERLAAWFITFGQAF